jgi:gas vesicle protein
MYTDPDGIWMTGVPRVMEKVGTLEEERVVSQQDLDSYLRDGWVIKRDWTTEESASVDEEVVNPEYEKYLIEYKACQSNGYASSTYEPSTSMILNKTVLQKVRHFLIARPHDVENLSREKAELSNAVYKLRQNIEELSGEHAQVVSKLKEDLRTAQMQVESEKEISSSLRNQLTEKEKELGESTVRTAKFLDILTVIWAECGNSRMRDVLGGRYPEDIDTLDPQKAARTIYDHLDEGG